MDRYSSRMCHHEGTIVDIWSFLYLRLLGVNVALGSHVQFEEIYIEDNWAFHHIHITCPGMANIFIQK